jgi:hypothetical protein
MLIVVVPALMHHVMTTQSKMEIQFHAFLTSALDGGEWSASRFGRFTPGDRFLGTPRFGSLLGPHEPVWVERR